MPVLYRSRRWLLVLMGTSVMVACGGGDDHPTPVNPPTTASNLADCHNPSMYTLGSSWSITTAANANNSESRTTSVVLPPPFDWGMPRGTVVWAPWGNDPATGALITSTDVAQQIDQDQNGGVGRLTAEYRLTEKTQLTAEVRGNRIDGDGYVDGLFETRDVGGALVTAYERSGDTRFNFSNIGATARIVHRFDDAGHEWSNELRFDRNDNENSSLSATDSITPEAADLYEINAIEGRQTTRGFTSAYVRPTADGGRVRAGYELTDLQPEQDSVFRRGASEGAAGIVPELSNRFEARQTVHALYGTWERPLTSKLSAQGGLRLEQAEIEIDDLTSGVSADQDYLRLYPTAHLQYQRFNISIGREMGANDGNSKSIHQQQFFAFEEHGNAGK